MLLTVATKTTGFNVFHLMVIQERFHKLALDAFMISIDSVTAPALEADDEI
jgi:hypothetical protein